MVMMWRGVSVVFLMVLVGGLWNGGEGGVGGGGVMAHPSKEDPAGCGPALEFLVQHNVATKEHLQHLPSNGSAVCGGGACCVPDMTEVLTEAGRASLRDVVRSTADSLYSALTSHRNTFHSVVEGALSSSEHRALKVFHATYPRLAPSARQVLHDLYSALRTALTDTDDRALDHAFAAFWDDLFPPVYHSALHARLPPFSRVYTECLRDAQRVVQPWGIIPTLVGEPLLRGLHSARLFLHSLDVGADVLNDARQFVVPAECGEASARLQFCGACHGALAPPCSGMCLNVARGCLAPLAEVDGAWADLAGAVDRVHESLVAVKLSHYLHQLPDKLSEAVMVALERGPKLQKKVRRECSTPTHEESTGSDGHHHHLPPPPVDLAHSVEERGVSGMIESASAGVRAVEAARGWWTGVADTHCKDLAAHDTHNCWNGVRVAPYSKVTAGVGVSAQKYNPEVRVGRPDTSVYSLADTLRGVRRLVLSKLTWLPEAEAQRRSYPPPDGSGSGGPAQGDWQHYGISDDEDSAGDENGSGGGGSGDDENVQIIKTETGTAPIEDDDGGAAHQQGNTLLLLLFILASALYTFHG